MKFLLLVILVFGTMIVVRLFGGGGG